MVEVFGENALHLSVCINTIRYLQGFDFVHFFNLID